MDGISITLVVPTLNEAANLPTLAEQIDAALRGQTYELLIVDDNSRDNTVAVCHQLSQRFPLRLITRSHPTNGLSGAVLHGMGEARGDIFAVMDADLQHPPAKLPELITPLQANDADFVIGSRYMEGGSIETGWTLYRRLNSGIATLLARPFAGHVSDPMSGFFALRREDYLNSKRLTPLGYKIALELLCKCRVQRVREVPIHFAKRQAGESKLTFKEQFRYLEHLSRLYDFSFPRLSPILKFAIVTLLAWVLAAAYYGSMISNGWGVLKAVAISYGWTIALTAVFHARYVRTQREFLLRPHPWVDFILAAAVEWVVCVAVAAYLVRRGFIDRPIETFLLAFMAAMGARYVLRKELMLDLRGLRHEIRKDELL